MYTFQLISIRFNIYIYFFLCIYVFQLNAYLFLLRSQEEEKISGRRQDTRGYIRTAAGQDLAVCVVCVCIWTNCRPSHNHQQPFFFLFLIVCQTFLQRLSDVPVPSWPLSDVPTNRRSKGKQKDITAHRKDRAHLPLTPPQSLILDSTKWEELTEPAGRKLPCHPEPGGFFFLNVSCLSG